MAIKNLLNIGKSLLIATLFFSCKTTETLTLLQINDVYEIAPLDNGAYGGMARVATVYKDLKKQNPNTYFIHAGDFLSPSVIGTLRYEGKSIKGLQMVEAMNAAGVEYVTFGNHEFDLDDEEPTALQERINASKFEWLVANMQQRKGGKTQPFEKITNGQPQPFPKSVILKAGKYKVGMLAVSIPVNKPYLVVEDIFESAKREYAALKPQCDFVIALTHINMADDRRLAQQLPNLKLIMGGHDHDNMRELIAGVPICKADANAKTAYIHQLKIKSKNKPVEVISTLKSIDKSVSSDPETAQVVEKWQNIATKSFNALGFAPDEIVTTITEPWDGREQMVRHQHGLLSTLIAKSMRSAAPTADLSIFNGGAIRIDDVLRGNVTQYDIVRILPFGGSIVEVTMTGELLQKVLESGRLNKGRGGFLHHDGATYDESAKAWAVNGNPIDLQKDYKVAMSDFLITGKEFGMSYLIPQHPAVKLVEKPSKDNPADLRLDIRKAFIDYLRKHK